MALRSNWVFGVVTSIHGSHLPWVGAISTGKGGMQPQQHRDPLPGDQPYAHSCQCGRRTCVRVGAGTLEEQPASPRHRVPSCTLSVPSSTARSVHQDCLQPCNPKPRSPYGSQGRIILVQSVFCGHQSAPLHLPSMFLSLLAPGSHCCSKNLVKVASPKHRASQPMQFLLLSVRN